MQAHFAHASGGACVNGYESALHLAVKSIISDAKTITLPECNFLTYRVNEEKFRHYYAESDPRNNYTSVEQFETNNDNLIAFAHIPSTKCSFEHVDLELYQGDVRPDIVCILGGRKLYVEVAVTHFVDNVKMEKLHARGISTIEIDVSSLKRAEFSYDNLKKLILDSGTHKKWLINSHAKLLALTDEPLRTARTAARKVVKDRREKQIEDKFGSTHEVTFLYGKQQNIIIKLCRQHISATIKCAYIDSSPTIRIKNLAETHNGKYIEKFRKWEFKPNLSIFYVLAQAFNNDCKLIKYICPPGQLIEFLANINKKPPSSALENPIITIDDKAVPTLDCEVKNRRSQIDAALAKARSLALDGLAPKNLNKSHSQNSASKHVIIYYSTKEDFLSLAEHTDEAWQLCQLAQFRRTSHTHLGHCYVDFELQVYRSWLAGRKDSKILRTIWAEENMHQGWPVP